MSLTQEQAPKPIDAVADSLHPAHEVVGDAFQARLLGQLAHHRLDEHLARLDAPTRD